jgi:hypothetical protein
MSEHKPDDGYRAVAFEVGDSLEKVNARIRELEARLASPVDILLFCPNCAEQHVDEAKPEVCETCGYKQVGCSCAEFTAWLNPPHKSHRCNYCNHVWRPADAPTNGVAAIQSKGQRDGDVRPRCQAQLAEANANIESLDTALENSAAEGILWIEKTARAEMRADAAEARAEAAETALADRIEHCKNHHSDVAKMRAALEMVEWVYDGTPHIGGQWGNCPWCRNRQPQGHKPNCARQAALTTALRPPHTHYCRHCATRWECKDSNCQAGEVKGCVPEVDVIAPPTAEAEDVCPRCGSLLGYNSHLEQTGETKQEVVIDNAVCPRCEWRSTPAESEVKK